MNDLSGKSALVTGASRGIGRVIAMRLASMGASVAVHYASSAEQAEDTVRHIRDLGGDAFPVCGDLASLPAIGSLFATLSAKFPTLDILVNNAGVLKMGEIETITEDDFDRIIGTNLKGTYFVTQQALKLMSKGGRIINISSNCTRVAYPEVSVYGLSKAGIENLTLSLAQGLGSRNITVNTLIPGIIDTDMNSSWLSEDTQTYVSGQTALGRLGSAEEIAAVAAFLASDAASWVTGQSIEASGGCRL